MNASLLVGKLFARREYDIRVDPKTGQKSDVSPVECMCCGRKIHKVHELTNGDIIGSECHGLLTIPIYRTGRKLNSRQYAYARLKGLL